MRLRAPFWLVMAGLVAWFMPWTATASADGYVPVRVSCPVAPVDLMVYGSGSGALADWSTVTNSGETITAAGADGACRGSAWWRTMLGTVLIAIGLGRANRVRLTVRPHRLATA
jgi:hypothetical protein